MSSRLGSPPPEALNEEQRAFYDELEQIVGTSFGGIFETKSPDGSFIGPFGVFMHNPALGRSFFATMIELAKLPGLPLEARQVIILTVARHFQSAYPEYAHSRLTVAKTTLSHEDVESILAGRVPGGLDQKSRVAYDIAKGLTENSGPLDSGVWEQAKIILGLDGTAAAVHFVGFYAYTCLLLNGFDARAPSN